MKGTAIGLSVLALSFVGGAAQAGTLWMANLRGANENPPNNSTNTGSGFLVLNTAETAASVTGTHDIPPARVTDGHIHRGPAGVNGPVILPFSNPRSPIGPVPWAIPAADVANLKAGGLYMNIHTAQFPGGEIRGQLARVLFANAATTPSQKSAGDALDVSAGLNADLDQVLFSMAVLPTAGRAAALADLSGDTIYAQGRLPTESMRSHQETIFQHAETGLADAQGFGLFGALDTEWGRRDNRDGQAGSKVTRNAIIAGVQYAWGGGMAAGAAVAYDSGKDKFRDGRGETEAKTTSIQAWFTAGNTWRVTAIGGYGDSNIDTDRNMPSLGRFAASSPDASVWAFAGKVSYPFEVASGWSLAPYGQIDAARARVDGYTETGGGAVSLIVPKHSYESSALEAGAALTVPFGGENGAWHARLQAGWRHLLEDGDDSLLLSFAGSPIGFTQFVSGPGRDAAHIDASIGGSLNERMTVSGGYRGLIGQRGNAHMVQVRLAYSM